ncbi:hypothetical protein EO244_00510 [Ancylomarina salipaludis]|uniref:Lanthionine synthetase C-like protein n=1 Tax=Ancylomarina salipaludis TaxID=2501299 RepID=A0A4Q1JPT6_9BACT|nr:lanthionine synthetase LanC family protein [Ancylomarina salipaludis]RXQ97404.1 hypothetical protein EO244_00510 [Ancylomarina salipaludis]
MFLLICYRGICLGMSEGIKSIVENRTLRVENMLLLNSSFIKNIGLMHGKMGISIFFYHLAQKSSQDIYQNYAEELIDEIYDEINDSASIDFENGLAGIGWGIEYLAQNGFIDANTDDVLEEFDRLLFEEISNDTSKKVELLDGLIGIGFYFLKRVQNLKGDSSKTSLNIQALIHLFELFDKKLTCQQIEEWLSDDIGVSGNNEFLKNELVKVDVKSIVKESFDITWNYTVLLWFLIEGYNQDVTNLKAKELILRLLKPLIDHRHWPKLYGKQLLILLCIEKLKSQCQNIYDDLHDFHCRLELEMSKVSPTILINVFDKSVNNLRFGLVGVAWVYQQLFYLTNKIDYQRMSNFLLKNKRSLDSQEKLFEFANGQQSLGVLEGLMGIHVFTHLYKSV